MSTFSLLAISFGGLALIMLALAAVKKQKTFLTVGYVLMTSSVVDAVIGMTLG